MWIKTEENVLLNSDILSVIYPRYENDKVLLEVLALNEKKEYNKYTIATLSSKEGATRFLNEIALSVKKKAELFDAGLIKAGIGEI